MGFSALSPHTLPAPKPPPPSPLPQISYSPLPTCNQTRCLSSPSFPSPLARSSEVSKRGWRQRGLGRGNPSCRPFSYAPARVKEDGEGGRSSGEQFLQIILAPASRQPPSHQGVLRSQEGRFCRKELSWVGSRESVGKRK